MFVVFFQELHKALVLIFASMMIKLMFVLFSKIYLKQQC